MKVELRHYPGKFRESYIYLYLAILIDVRAIYIWEGGGWSGPLRPSKHKTFLWLLYNVGPTSSTLNWHFINAIQIFYFAGAALCRTLYYGQYAYMTSLSGIMLCSHYIFFLLVYFSSTRVTQREWSFLLLLWGLSDPRIAELREMPQSFIIKLYSETQVSGRLGMSGGISPRHAQNPLSGERRKTLSITHHALSPPPSHHHLYIIHLINWLQRFYRIIMSLKRPFVPKSDVKQWFTTTTTCPEPLIGRAKENALNNPPCSITPTLTSSSVHHSSH